MTNEKITPSEEITPLYCGACHRECYVARMDEVESDHIGKYVNYYYVSDCCQEPIYTEPEQLNELDQDELSYLWSW
jgi:hypothetical protein